jgi:hypothetical protein
MKKKAIRATELVFALAVALNIAWFIYLVWTHLNVYQNDLMGHIASAAAFKEGLFHRFNDGAFLGFIQGLFYPPLEDALIAVVSFFTKNNFILAFQIYLSLLLLGYAAVLIRFAQVFETAFFRILFLIGSILILNLGKLNTADFQGLSSIDILKMGLESEVLAAIGFFEFLRAWLKDRSFKTLIFWLSWILLSHLVLAIAAFAFGALAFFSELFQIQKNPESAHAQLKKIFLVFTTSFCLSAFFYIPFLAYQKFLVHGAVYRPLGWIPFIFVLAAMALSNKKTLPLTVLAFLFFVPLKIFSYLQEPVPLLPLLHYYRFAIVAVWLALIGWLLSGEDFFQTKQDRKKKIWLATLAIGICLLPFQYHVANLGLPYEQMTPQSWQPEPSSENVTHSLQGRTWSIPNNRNIDFSLDGKLRIENPDFTSVKGLYWESHRSNLVLTSYLTSLLGKNAILDYFYYTFESCAIEQCFVEHFSRDYNISSIIMDPTLNAAYIGLPLKACLKETVQTGTPHYAFQESPGIRVGYNSYKIYELVKRKNFESEAFSNQIITPVAKDDLVSFSYNTPYFYRDYMKQIYGACRVGKISNQVFIPNLDSNKLDLPKDSNENIGYTIKKTTAGSYEITSTSSTDQLFRIKLSYLPGVHLQDSEGHELPLFEALPGMVGVGHGKMYLVYEKTVWMYLGYLISLVSLILVICLQKGRESSNTLA